MQGSREGRENEFEGADKDRLFQTWTLLLLWTVDHWLLTVDVSNKN
jgi:hypothetical protein